MQDGEPKQFTLNGQELYNEKQKSRASKSFEKQFKYLLFAPIITWPSYEDLVTQEMKERIRLERFANSSEESSDYEAMVYLHTASLAGPVSHEWFNIYSHLFSKYYAEKAKGIGLNSNQLNDYEVRELGKLKHWIYTQQMKALKDKDVRGA